METENIRKAKNFNELLNAKYGKIGTETRDNFEEKAQYFVSPRRSTSFLGV